MKAKNDPVGTSECPIKRCDKTVTVYRYRHASDDAKKRRFAGRLYCVCEVHGRVENQEFLLEHIQWAKGQSATGADASGASKPPPSPPVKTPVKQASRPVQGNSSTRQTPAAPEPAPESKSSWLPEFFK
jgi:hypothetical protein